MDDVTIVIPLWGRWTNVERLANSIIDTTPTAEVIWMCSDGDLDVQESAWQTGVGWVEVLPGPTPGDYAKKINAAARLSSRSYLFTGADDIVFHEGWFEAASALMVDPVGVVGTNDLGNPEVLRGEHSTHSLVSRRYAEEFGTIDQPGLIYHEGYFHNFCDNELVETAKSRGAFAFAGDAIVEHIHPSWSKVEKDDTYRRGDTRFEDDRRLFKQRRRLWT